MKMPQYSEQISTRGIAYRRYRGVARSLGMTTNGVVIETLAKANKSEKKTAKRGMTRGRHVPAICIASSYNQA